jgi:LacI family transcriptional regulator
MSLKSIHELTGFSYSTISRVLNAKAERFRISQATCDQILTAAKQTAHRPNIVARSLRLGRSMTIGLLVSDIQNPFFGTLASKIERLLRPHQYSTILCNTNELVENEESYLRVLVDRQVDGVIIAPVHTKAWKHLQKIRDQTSVVLVDRLFYDADAGLPGVTSDNVRAAQDLTEELIKLGFRRIAFLGGARTSYISIERFKGFQAAMHHHSLPIDPDLLFFEDYSIDAGFNMMERLVHSKGHFDAVICVNNQVFIGALKSIDHIEKENKRYIMTAAFDLGAYCHVLQRPLISAEQDLDKLAALSVKLLFAQIDHRHSNTYQYVIPARINKCGLERRIPA